MISLQSRLENVDTHVEQEDDERSSQWQRHASSFDEMSTASSAADLSYVTPSNEFEATSEQLGDAFVGDLQYDDADEQLHGVQVAVLQSSSTSSSSSVTEHSNITDARLPDTAAVQTSWEVFGASSEPKDEDNCSPMSNGNELWKARQPANVVTQVTFNYSSSSLFINYSCYTSSLNLDYSQSLRPSSVVFTIYTFTALQAHFRWVRSTSFVNSRKCTFKLKVKIIALQDAVWLQQDDDQSDGQKCKWTISFCILYKVAHENPYVCKK